MAMMLLTALGMALMLTTTTETMIAANYRDGIEGMYAADAGIERTMQDLLTVPDWNNVLASDDGVQAHLMSGFTGDTLTPVLGDGRTLDLRKATAVGELPAGLADADLLHRRPDERVDGGAPVGHQQPAMAHLRPRARSRTSCRPPPSTRRSTSSSGSPTTRRRRMTTRRRTERAPRIRDPGVIQLRAEAFGPGGAHRVIEVTLARTDNTEIERGYTGQRGQDEQNRRARKAAVQTPGTSLTRQEMSLSAGGLN